MNDRPDNSPSPRRNQDNTSSALDYAADLQRLSNSPLHPWVSTLEAKIIEKLATPHGDLERWLASLDALPSDAPTVIDVNNDTVAFGSESQLSQNERAALARALMTLHPWRKGPFSIFGIHIDTEWRSDWKWQRIAPHLAPLSDRLVLDVGCGSGYHCWRMRGAGAALVLGIEPMWLYNVQFRLAQKLARDANVQVLPLTLEDLPPALPVFDTIFSLGILYHRQSPLEHIATLHALLRPGGELVLETLVVAGDGSTVLMPAGRYAKMRNVWFIPSCGMILRWLHRVGLRNARCVDVTPTTTDEQRSTQWMTFESLADFLDPNDPAKTIEGLPAPIRATFIANKA